MSRAEKHHPKTGSAGNSRQFRSAILASGLVARDCSAAHRAVKCLGLHDLHSNSNEDAGLRLRAVRSYLQKFEEEIKEGTRMRKLYVLAVALAIPLGVLIARSNAEYPEETPVQQPGERQVLPPQASSSTPTRSRASDYERRRSDGIKHSYARAGKSAGRGGAELGKNFARGGKEFGKGMAGFGRNFGSATAKLGKRIVGR